MLMFREKNKIKLRRHIEDNKKKKKIKMMVKKCKKMIKIQ